jgi:hypothetical protein
MLDIDTLSKDKKVSGASDLLEAVRNANDAQKLLTDTLFVLESMLQEIESEAV